MKRQRPPLYPWQRTILRLLTAEPGLTIPELGERYAPRLPRYLRASAARHELRILEQARLVQQSRGGWSPSLMAAMELGGQP